jgi:3-oxoacid CoA-transferase subunit A
MNSVGYFYLEDEFPNLWFAEDGQILNIEGKSFLVLGGAYSVYAPGKKDGEFWWEDEQMSPVLKDRTLELIKDKNNKIDYILSHTAPLSKIPDMGWIKDIDKSKLDLSFEKWLDELDKLIEYKKWFIGHYHINHVNQKYNYVYKELIVID